MTLLQIITLMLLGARQIVQSERSRQKRPTILLLQTLQMYQSVTEGGFHCCNSIMHGVGVALQQG